ncbi:MAG: hypothetical protein ACJ71U_09865 [Terriglobales bacterium]
MFFNKRITLCAATASRAMATVLFLGLITGCVANRPYRTQVTPLPEMPEGASSSVASVQPPKTTYQRQSSGIVLSNGADRKYDLAYIEFDDMGEYWTIGDLTGQSNAVNDSQVERTVRLIQIRQQEKNPLAVVTFIHGWKNNASPHDEDKDGNLKSFKHIMMGLAESDQSRHYIGVFVAWRGQVIPGNIFTSYWNRRGAAMRVGGPSMTEALFRLMFVTKPPIAPTLENECGRKTEETSTPATIRDPVTGKGLAENAITGIDKKGDAAHRVAAKRSFARDRFVIVAHSFGARVMERALSQPLMSLLYERQSEASSCIARWKENHPNEAPPQISFQSPADLITMINAANDSFETKAMIEGMTRMGLVSCIDTKCSSAGASDAHPLIVSILSDGDWATKTVMPIAQRISYFEQNLNRKYDRDPNEKGQIDEPKQRTFFLRNEGSVPQLISHTLNPDPKLPSLCVTEYPHFSNKKQCFTLQAKLADAKHFVNRTPFWVFDVPTSVIAGHNGIFQPATVELLRMMIKNAMDAKQQLNLSIASKAENL